MKAIACVVLLLLTNLSFGANFFGGAREGWFWYAVPPVDKSLPHLTPTTQRNANTVMQAVHARTKTLRNLAVLSPTPDHVQAYMTWQHALTRQSARFGKMWQQVLWQTPALDPTTTQPVNSVGRLVYRAQQQRKQDKALAAISQHIGLIFFYDIQCPYCQQYAPILKRFSDRAHLSVLAISPDGQHVPDWPATKKDRGQLAAFSVTRFPQVVIVGEDGQQLGRMVGLLTEDELTARIIGLTRERGSDA